MDSIWSALRTAMSSIPGQVAHLCRPFYTPIWRFVQEYPYNMIAILVCLVLFCWLVYKRVPYARHHLLRQSLQMHSLQVAITLIIIGLLGLVVWHWDIGNLATTVSNLAQSANSSSHFGPEVPDYPTCSDRSSRDCHEPFFFMESQANLRSFINANKDQEESIDLHQLPESEFFDALLLEERRIAVNIRDLVEDIHSRKTNTERQLRRSIYEALTSILRREWADGIPADVVLATLGSEPAPTSRTLCLYTSNAHDQLEGLYIDSELVQVGHYLEQLEEAYHDLRKKAKHTWYDAQVGKMACLWNMRRTCAQYDMLSPLQRQALHSFWIGQRQKHDQSLDLSRGHAKYRAALSQSVVKLARLRHQFCKQANQDAAALLRGEQRDTRRMWAQRDVKVDETSFKKMSTTDVVWYVGEIFRMPDEVTCSLEQPSYIERVSVHTTWG